MTAWGISKWAYEELRALCRQYPEKKAEAAALAGTSAVRYGDAPRGSGVGDPTAKAALKRIRLLKDCQLIEQVARSVDGGRWYDALLLNCCYGRGYEYLDPSILPTSNRSAYFRARREFFFLLYQARYEDAEN